MESYIAFSAVVFVICFAFVFANGRLWKNRYHQLMGRWLQEIQKHARWRIILNQKNRHISDIEEQLSVWKEKDKEMTALDGCYPMFKGVRYKHYKGDSYLILGLAFHTETQEKLVIYKSEKDSKIWARPYDMFTETLEDGTKRFERIDSGRRI